LPAPWIVLVNRRPSAADGPPWVRFLALHRDKGIALVDVVHSEAAVAPLEDYFARTGFHAFRVGTVPVVSVVVGANQSAILVDLLYTAFYRACALSVTNHA